MPNITKTSYSHGLPDYHQDHQNLDLDANPEDSLSIPEVIDD